MLHSDADFLLSFELSADKDELFIQGNPAGLRSLARKLEHLASKAEAGEMVHDHLFTPDWGGYELTAQAQSSDTHCLNHVKIYGLPVIKDGAN